MTLKKILLSLAGCLGILGTLLPWYKASIFGITATSNAFSMGALYIILAIIIILCSAAVILLNVMKEKQIKNIIKIKFDLSKLPLFLGIAMVVAAVIAFIAIKSESQGFGGTSWGLWLIGLAGVAIIVLPFLKNIKQLDKVVLGQPEKTSETEKAEKKEATKKK